MEIMLIICSILEFIKNLKVERFERIGEFFLEPHSTLSSILIDDKTLLVFF